MSKQTVGEDRAHYTGEAPWHEQSGGRITGSQMLSDDDGFGTPIAPGLRGEAYGKTVPSGRSIGGRNKMIDQFIKKRGGK